MIADLKRLWLEAFGDSPETVAAFFTTGFSEDRYNCILEQGVPVSALYWFDCGLDGNKLAYIYAVATAKSHQGKGLAHNLMERTHVILKEKGYVGAVLVPGSEKLFDFYRKMGYRVATTIREFSCISADTSVSLTQIDAVRYAQLRKTYLPPCSVLQEGAALSYLQTYGQFYEGEDFLLAASKQNDTLLSYELLGNTQAAPKILKALNLPKGTFRTPGAGRNFAMFLPLTPNCPTPCYFGLALD